MGSSGVRVDLRGGQALVTGGARGLGAAIVRRLAGAGASVLVADVRKELARELCDELNGDGGDACFVELDVRDPDAVAGVFRELDGVGRAVDVLVNNAAVDVSKPIEHLTADEVTRVVQTNLLGPVYLCLEAYRRMVARGGPHREHPVHGGQPHLDGGRPYAAGKTGLRAFTHTLFKEAQRDCPGIGVTGIVAGGMETPFIMDRFPETDDVRCHSPDIVADAVLYALSVPEGSVAGEIVVVPRREPSWP
ncbi:SDR family oxidoreductase [Streptomyces somaliensis]|uniref:SDR family oxidoreductase n=1 Tax=Streptomyces somaliensis TaxID=78355 RepID=UPI0034E97B1E|nr:SDR family oxidoreductase [Streptomyces somaliensis]